MMYKTIPEIFFESAQRYASRQALLYKKEGVYFPITYKELAEKVVIFASYLQKLGIGKGDKVAILSENRPEWVIADLAIMLCGAIVVPLHSTFSPKAIYKVLNHSEAKVLIVSNENLLNKVLLEREKQDFVEKIILMQDVTSVLKEMLGHKILSWRVIMNRKTDHNFTDVYFEPEDPCSIIYTSGTTGEPKGVILTHRNFLSDVQGINEVVPVKKGDVFLSFLPLSHVLERTAGYYDPIVHGATIAYAESTKLLQQNLKEVRPTILISVPRIFEKFNDAIWDKVNSGKKWEKKLFEWALRQKKGTWRYAFADRFVFKKIRKKLGGRLRLAISGGASLGENIPKFFSKLGIHILEGYGLTETSPVVLCNREHECKFGTVGKVLPDMRVKISPEKEILVKGANVFSQYYKNPEATAEAFDQDGWFKTGDMGFIDNKGFVTITGRKKEMIVTAGGKNVWPEPIENLLNNDRFVAQSMVIGDWQKFISALIVPDWNEVEKYLKENNLPMKSHEDLIRDEQIHAIFAERLETKINPNLSDYEKVHRFKLLPREFSQEQDELTPTLKLRRHIIKMHNEKLIGSIYEE